MWSDWFNIFNKTLQREWLAKKAWSKCPILEFSFSSEDLDGRAKTERKINACVISISL